MTKQHGPDRVPGWRYGQECLWILYAMVLQPLRFKAYLSQIDSSLSLKSRYLDLCRRSQRNPRVDRFLHQLQWGQAVAPLILTLAGGGLYTSIFPRSFNWLEALPISVGFFLGSLSLKCVVSLMARLPDSLAYLTSFCFTVVCFILLGYTDPIVIFVASLGEDVVFGVLGEVARGVAGGGMIGVALWAALGGVGIAFGVAGGVVAGGALGVAVGWR